MSLREVTVVAGPTASDGSGTFYSDKISGYIESIRYVKDGTTPYSDGVDPVISVEETGELIWDEDNVNASTIRRPRAPTHDQVGVAALYAAAGQPVNDRIAVKYSRIKVVIANGGDTKTGRFIVCYDGSR